MSKRETTEIGNIATSMNRFLKKTSIQNRKLIIERTKTLANNFESVTKRYYLKVLKVRTGRLRGSFDKVYEEQGDRIKIGMKAVTNYARIQHEGGTIPPHVILPRNAKVLRWTSGGQVMFAKSVNHPGSRIKPKYYFRDPMKVEFNSWWERIKEDITIG